MTKRTFCKNLSLSAISVIMLPNLAAFIQIKPIQVYHLDPNWIRRSYKLTPADIHFLQQHMQKVAENLNKPRKSK